MIRKKLKQYFQVPGPQKYVEEQPFIGFGPVFYLLFGGLGTPKSSGAHLGLNDFVALGFRRRRPTSYEVRGVHFGEGFVLGI